MAMKKSELRELYLMMFPEYPDIVNITQLQSMLGISRHLAYDLINDGYIRGLKIGNAFRIPCLLYTSPSPRDRSLSRMPSSA